MFNMNLGEKPCHIFLTGKKHVGKTTLVEKIAKDTDLSWQGIKSVSLFEDGARYVYLTDAKTDSIDKENLVGICKDGKIIKTNPQVFDKVGCKLLEVSQGTELFIIDEIGFMENEAELYRQKLLELLDRTDIHVLGILRQDNISKLYNVIRKHSNVKNFVITEANRDRMAPVVDRLLHGIHRD